MSLITIALSFLAGLLSFLSPCTLPLYPTYLSYITGISASGLQYSSISKEIRLHVMLHSLLFIFGVSFIFMALGSSASLLGELFISYKESIRLISGVLMMVMGLLLMGLIKPGWFMKEFRWHAPKKTAGYLGSVLIGLGFAAGWTPCIGPMLSSIISLSASRPDEGMIYVAAYTLGFAVPFVGLSFFIGSTKWLLRYSSKLMKIGGAVMILAGFLLFANKLTVISITFNEWFQFNGI